MNSYSVAEKINQNVNENKSYLSDYVQHGVPDYWGSTGRYGDCEDFSIAKRNALLEKGWPLNKLGLCTCLTESGEGHCCLWVDTDKGSFILDNNYALPVKPSSLNYKWESMLCDGQWLSLLSFS